MIDNTLIMWMLLITAIVVAVLLFIHQRKSTARARLRKALKDGTYEIFYDPVEEEGTSYDNSMVCSQQRIEDLRIDNLVNKAAFEIYEEWVGNLVKNGGKEGLCGITIYQPISFYTIYDEDTAKYKNKDIFREIDIKVEELKGDYMLSR